MIVHVLWERLQDQVPQAMIFWGENPQERKWESSVEHGDSCHTTMSSPKWRRWGRSDAVNLLDSWQTKEGFSRLSVSSWAKVSHMRYCMPPRNRLAFLCLPDSSIRLVQSVGNTGSTQWGSELVFHAAKKLELCVPLHSRWLEACKVHAHGCHKYGFF